MGWNILLVNSEFHKENDIARHKIVAKNPQQNDVIERMNKTIMERVRSMLSNAKLPKSF